MNQILTILKALEIIEVEMNKIKDYVEETTEQPFNAREIAMQWFKECMTDITGWLAVVAATAFIVWIMVV